MHTSVLPLSVPLISMCISKSLRGKMIRLWLFRDNDKGDIDKSGKTQRIFLKIKFAFDKFVIPT